MFSPIGQAEFLNTFKFVCPRSLSNGLNLMARQKAIRS
jgi:hypothetical protein